jgi:hypothetical protein
MTIQILANILLTLFGFYLIVSNYFKGNIIKSQQLINESYEREIKLLHEAIKILQADIENRKTFRYSISCGKDA